MERPTTRLRVGAWCVDPARGEISKDGERVRLEVRAMRLLVCLVDNAGEVVSIDDALKQVWPDVVVTPDSVYQAVASLRRVLGDDPKQPKYIATVPRLGYRMLAPVSPWTDERPVVPGRGRSLMFFAGTASCLVAVVALLVVSNTVNTQRSAPRAGAPIPKSIAVLPFLDLTEKMKEEEFADGLTEELIDRLSKIPGFRVPPPTSSFHFKGKQSSVAEVAKALDVAYVLDGSTRKSGDRLRVAARLIRADSGVTVWSDSYDRPWGDILTVQDDIAGEVTKALAARLPE